MGTMMRDSYINIPQSDRDRFVYRIIPLDRLYQLFRHKQNVLVKPVKWDDPYENLRSLFTPSGGQHECYGQCWTLHQASDAMWRIYSPGPIKSPTESAVRIRSTIRNLVETLSQGCKSTGVAFIGRVRYLNTRKLMDYVRQTCCSDSLP
jgi:hypothetical protein